MEQTKTMVVIPQDLLDSLRYNQREKMGPVGEQLVSLDRQMKTILNQDSDDDSKAKLYYQTLQKYLATKDRLKMPPVATAAVAVPKAGSFFDDIPRLQKTKAEKIFNWLERVPTDITWDLKGEVEGIPGSNIADLVNELSKVPSKTQPRGFDEFTERLRDANIPKTLVANQKHWDTHFDDTLVAADDIHSPMTPQATPQKKPMTATPQTKPSLRSSRKDRAPADRERSSSTIAWQRMKDLKNA